MKRVIKTIEFKNGKTIRRRYIEPPAQIRLRENELGVVQCDVEDNLGVLGVKKNNRLFIFRDGCKIEVRNPLLHL